MAGHPNDATYIYAVFVRVIAVLLALGMLAISVQTSPLSPASTTTALVDGADPDDGLPPFQIVEPAVVALCEVRLVAAPASDPLPTGHRHELSVFRPPRAVAFA